VTFLTRFRYYNCFIIPVGLKLNVRMHRYIGVDSSVWLYHMLSSLHSIMSLLFSIPNLTFHGHITTCMLSSPRLIRCFNLFRLATDSPPQTTFSVHCRVFHLPPSSRQRTKSAKRNRTIDCTAVVSAERTEAESLLSQSTAEMPERQLSQFSGVTRDLKRNKVAKDRISSWY